MNAKAREPGRTVRRRVVYRGAVQGVGFRMTTASLAKRHSVVGYVKNLRDGTVELAVEGESSAVESFLNDVAETFSRNITDAQVSEFDSPESFANFGVRY